jgi:hypothetical protein
MSFRKKPCVAFWATVVLVALLVAYPLSFGPACWWFGAPLSSRMKSIAWSGPDPLCPPQIYWPVGWLAQNGPSPVGDAIFRFARLFGSDGIGVPESDGIALPTSPSAARRAWYSETEHVVKRFSDAESPL